MSTAALLALAAFLAYAAHLWSKQRAAARSVGALSGPVSLVSPATLWAYLFPEHPLVNLGPERQINSGYADFEAVGAGAYVHTNFWPKALAVVYVADPAAVKEITTYRSRYPKPVENYELVSFFGRNIVASEGEEWKRFRRVAAPAFSEKNNRVVWDETIHIVNDMLDNVWKREEVVHIAHATDFTLPLALLIIGVAGFGRRMSFTEERDIPAGYTISFKDALHTVAQGLFFKLALPKWAMKLTPKLRKIERGIGELERYLMAMIHARRTAEKQEERYDLFSGLLDAANDEGDGVPKLADSELLGNIFIFLLAGHETTAHTLAFCFALLALYPEKQEKLYQHIKDITLDIGRTPMYEDMPLFTYALAVLNETLRIRPSVTAIPKKVGEDTVLNVSNSQGGTTAVSLPAGVLVNIHTPGLHMNPQSWPSPEDFVPERFLGDYNRDAFLPFSGGPRACLGRRFAETESIAILTVLVSQYRVEVKEDPKYAGETPEQTRARLMKSTVLVTTSPTNIPLTFKRRL